MSRLALNINFILIATVIVLQGVAIFEIRDAVLSNQADIVKLKSLLNKEKPRDCNCESSNPVPAESRNNTSRA